MPPSSRPRNSIRANTKAASDAGTTVNVTAITATTRLLRTSCQNAALKTPLASDPGTRWEYGTNMDWCGQIVEAITSKMIRRHPHVFGDADVKTADAQTAAWEEHKRKERLCKHLLEKYRDWFGVEFEFLLYDVTSTYFEGQAQANPEAARGYSRDHRPDCKQVNIGLVVTPEGLPIGYEIFAGNKAVPLSTTDWPGVTAHCGSANSTAMASSPARATTQGESACR